MGRRAGGAGRQRTIPRPSDLTAAPARTRKFMFPAALANRSANENLEPLAVAHAAELAPLLDDPSLHEFTGGAPLSVAALAARRSPEGDQMWGNWVARARATGTVAGTVQATLSAGGPAAGPALAATFPRAGRPLARLSQGAAGLAAGGRAAPIPAVAGVASGCDGLGASMVPVMPAGRRATGRRFFGRPTPPVRYRAWCRERSSPPWG